MGHGHARAWGSFRWSLSPDRCGQSRADESRHERCGKSWRISVEEQAAACKKRVCVRISLLPTSEQSNRGQAMKTAYLTILLIAWAATACAQTEKHVDACRAVLEENFNAFNYEDVDKLVATISPGAAPAEKIEEFRREAESLFAEGDVYIRLVAFKPLELRGNRLVAHVLQHTFAEGQEDARTTLHEFRNRSALLPQYRFAKYKQEFIWDKRKKKWQLGAIVGRPRSVMDPYRFAPEGFDEIIEKQDVPPETP